MMYVAGCPMVKKSLKIHSAVSTEYRRVTNGQTSCDSIVHAAQHRAVKTANSDICVLVIPALVRSLFVPL